MRISQVNSSQTNLKRKQPPNFSGKAYTQISHQMQGLFNYENYRPAFNEIASRMEKETKEEAKLFIGSQDSAYINISCQVSDNHPCVHVKKVILSISKPKDDIVTEIWNSLVKAVPEILK